MKQPIILTFLLFISCGTNSKQSEASDQRDDDRIACALTFVNEYIKEYSSPEELNKWLHGNELTTDSFRAEYKRIVDDGWKTDPEMGLGYDPILESQDCPDQGYELDFVDEKTGYIHLRGKGEDQFKIVINVIEKDSKYLVDGSGIVNMP